MINHCVLYKAGQLVADQEDFEFSFELMFGTIENSHNLGSLVTRGCMPR